MGTFRAELPDNIQLPFHAERQKKRGGALYIGVTFDRGIKVSLIERNKLTH